MALVGLLGCGGPIASTAEQDGSTGGSRSTTTAVETTSSGVPGTSGGASSGAQDTDSGGESSTGELVQCEVEVLAATQLSDARFGVLTLTDGDSNVMVAGSRGWTLADSVEAPVAQQVVESEEPLMVGRFGPGGAWAFGEPGPALIRVLPLNDPDAVVETSTGSIPSSLVGDLDDDGLDDLVVVTSGRYDLWRADGDGGFVWQAQSEDSYPRAFRGFAPATAWTPAALLIVDDAQGLVGLELSGDVLEKAYAVELILAWSVQGVQPLSNVGRSILVAQYGGALVDPLEGYVGFIDGQDGGWTGRGVDFGQFLLAPPGALDLDADGTLDAVAATTGMDGSLRGGCSRGDVLVPCLDHAVAGTPESIAVREDGAVFVATEDQGLWVYRLGECL